MNRFTSYTLLLQTKDGVKARISLDTTLNEMNLSVAGFDSTLCDADEFQNLCDKDVSALKAGQEMLVDGVQIVVLDVDKQTVDEFNAECERLEAQNCVDY